MRVCWLRSLQAAVTTTCCSLDQMSARAQLSRGHRRMRPRSSVAGQRCRQPGAVRQVQRLRVGRLASCMAHSVMSVKSAIYNRLSFYWPTLGESIQAGHGSSSAHTSRASAGWGGASELSSLLDKSLTLQSASSQQADRQPAAVAAAPSAWQDASWHSSAQGSSVAASMRQPSRQGSGDSGQRRSPEGPQARLTKARSLLADAALVAKLPDRGAKLREQVAELERQVQRGHSSKEVVVG